MADNAPITPGSGLNVTTDEVSDGSHAQVMKLAISTDGSRVLVPADTSGLQVQGAAAADAAVAGNPVLGGGKASAAAPSDVSADGDAVPDWNLRNGAKAVAITAAGALIPGDASNGLDVDLTRASFEMVDNAGFTDGTSKVVPSGYILDETVGTSLTENDVAAARIDAKRAQVFSIEDKTTRGQRATVTANSSLQVDPQGNVAHDASDSGNPVKVGYKAKSSLAGITAVGADDRTDAYADIDGVQLVRGMCPLGDVLSERVSNTDGNSTACAGAFAAPGAGIRLYVTTIIVHNAHASTNGYVDIRDGSAGSVLATIPLPANGGAVVPLPVPLRLSANTALAYDVSAAISTVYLTFIGFKSKA